MKNLKKLISVLIVVCMSLTLILVGCGGDNKGGKKEFMQAYTGGEVKYDNRFWEKPKIEYYEDIVGGIDPLSDNTFEAVFFRGADYKGNETRVFAYVGFPEEASKQNPVPGIVLVHGGGGTAYKEFALEWIKRGYAAICIDYQGNMPLANCKIDTQNYVEIPGYTSPKNDYYEDYNEEIKDQWMYYATSAAIIANSLLRSYPEVDKNKVGIAGISWGGVITAITISYDDRFAFACPIYCALYNSDRLTNGSAFQKEPHWDDDGGYKQSKMPMLLTCWDKETNATMNVLSKSYLNKPNSYLSVKNGSEWWHSHGGGIYAREPYAFADSICKKANSLINITSQPTKESDKVEFEVPNGVTVARYELMTNSNTSLGSSQTWTRKFVERADNLNDLLPQGTHFYYFNIIDGDGNIISSAICDL